MSGRFLGETIVTKVEGLRAVDPDAGQPPRLEITFTAADGMGVIVLPAREAALLRDYLAQGLDRLQNG